jgi:hypothetical protein
VGVTKDGRMAEIGELTITFDWVRNFLGTKSGYSALGSAKRDVLSNTENR